MIIVIADDVTGAAEMAGVALRNNLKVQFVTEVDNRLPETDILVIATDTRSMSREEAVETMKHIAGYLKENKDIRVFKKTDSVMRGHIMPELETLAACMGYEKTILLPQNPSKGRIIKGGTYYIDGVLLDKTSFSYDPEFPATSARVEQIAKAGVSMSLGGQPQHGKVNIGDASGMAELAMQVDKADNKTLVAGGADTFNILLHKLGISGKGQHAGSNAINSGKTLVLCGSTQSKSLIDMPYFKKMKSVEEGMPLDVFHGNPADEWIASLQQSYTDNEALIIKIGHKAVGGKEYAIRLRGMMSAVAHRLISSQKPLLLIIEGGATAFAVLKELGWNVFDVKKELSPGVVCLSYDSTDIILKPGSYPWGGLFE